jgi:hypothetical protein
MASAVVARSSPGMIFPAAGSGDWVAGALVGAELATHGGDLWHRWAVMVGHDR